MFILPAFLLCLSFTNLQPRFMILIYQNMTQNQFNIRQILCRFNLYHYGSLLLTYPLIYYTNLNWPLFIAMSCVIFPQIYTNGMNGIRPELSHTFYTKYMLGRFIIIVPLLRHSSISNASLIMYSSSNQITFSD